LLLDDWARDHPVTALLKRLYIRDLELGPQSETWLGLLERVDRDKFVAPWADYANRGPPLG